MKPASASGALLLFSLLLDFVAAKLQVTLETAVKLEGQSISIMCRDTDAGSGLTWRGPKNKPINVKPSASHPYVRYKTLGAILTFQEIKKEHAGTYTCSSSTDSIQFELIVATRIIFLDTPTNVTEKEGRDAFLKCETNSPNAEIVWQIDGVEPPKDDVKYKVLADGLLIRNLTPSDGERQYTCKAFLIDLGDYIWRNISLTVKHPPRTLVKEVIVYGYLEGAVNLTCEVEAVPIPKFTWYQKNNRIKLIGRELQVSNPKVSVLSLFLKEKKDFGEYKCEARNTEGVVEVRFSLLPGTQPAAPQIMEIRDSNSTSIAAYVVEPEITEAENQSGMVPTGVRIEYRSDEDAPSYWHAQDFPLAEDKIYALANLMPNTTYEVRAATINLAGYSEFTNQTEFTTPSSGVSLTINMSGFLCTLFFVLISTTI